MFGTQVKLYLVFMVCLFFCACGSRSVSDISNSFADTDESAVTAPKTEFTQEELLEDYDQLCEDLEANYPFFPVLTQRGMNISALKEYYQNLLTDRITDLEGFAVLLNNLFFDMNNLEHLSLMEPEFYYDMLQMAEEERLGFTEEPWKSLLGNEQTRASYALLRPETDNAGRSESLFPEIVTEYYEDQQAVYLRITSFNHLLIERDRDIIWEYVEEHKNAKHVIIDIQGNRGGSDYYWMENIVALFGGEYSWKQTLFFKESPVTKAFYYDRIPEFVRITDADVLPQSVRELGMTHMGVFESVYPADIDCGMEETTRLQDVKRWVLIDERVYSAADSFSDFCRQSGWAVLVGKETEGGGVGPMPVAIVLKNTGLLVRFGNTVYLREDRSISAGKGVAPDVICKTGESALETCLRVISDFMWNE